MNIFSLSTLHKRLYLLSPIFRSRIGIALLVLLSAGVTHAAEIYVDGAACQLSDAIIAANTDQALYGCVAGAGADTLILTRDIKLQLGDLPTITSDISIVFTDLAAQSCHDSSDDPPGSSDDNDDPPDDPPSRDDPPGFPDDNDEPPPDDDDPPKNPPSDPTSAPPTDPPTATPTDPPTATPTDPPTAPPTEAATAPPTDPPTAPPFNTATNTPNGTATATGTTSVTPTLPGTSTGTPGATAEFTIPEYCLHVVARDETLFRIALRYEMTVNQFSTFNNLQSVNRLDVGQELIIPSEPCMQYVPRKG